MAYKCTSTPSGPHTALIRLILDEKNPKLRDLIRSKVEEYLDRAEKLKNHIAASDEKRQKQAVATNGKPAGGGGGSGQAKSVPRAPRHAVR